MLQLILAIFARIEILYVISISNQIVQDTNIMQLNQHENIGYVFKMILFPDRVSYKLYRDNIYHENIYILFDSFLFRSKNVRRNGMQEFYYKFACCPCNHWQSIE